LANKTINCLTKQPLINREFFWFIIARFLFIAGLRMTPVLLGWKLYEVTGSKLSSVFLV
jgi:hypothetical protein